MSASLTRKLTQAEQRLRSGDASGALELCTQVLKSAPRNPDALFLIGMAHLSMGRAGDAVTPFEQALAADPRNGAALENLGLAHLMRGQFGAAEHALSRAAAMSGAPASVFMRLGVAILEQGRAAEALAPLRRAFATAPGIPEVCLNLGRALAAGGDIDGARAQFQAALDVSPQYADAAFNLGLIDAQQRAFNTAAQWFERTLAITPDYSAAHEQLAAIALTLGRFGDAAAHLRAVVKLDPANVAAVAALANALFEVGALDDALASAEQAIRLDPTSASAYATAANTFLVRGDLAAAIERLESGYARTNASGLLGMLTYQLRHACDWKRWAPLWGEMQRQLENDAELGSPFWMLCEPISAAQQLAYAHRHAVARFGEIAKAPQRAPAKARPPADSGRRIRVGYLSSDLHEHATAYLIAEVLEQHDRDRFEIFAYSYGPEDGSAMRQRLRNACEHFVDIARVADDVAADRIRDDAVDLLVDLKGYTLGDRLSIMAYRPCDVQITWLGYPGSTGAAFIDHAIADAFVVPAGSEHHYSERILRMPHCYQPNDRKRAVAAPRARDDYDLPREGFVFCCFNQTYKITPGVFAVWLRVLDRIPGSVLWLLESNSLAAYNLRAVAQAHGLAPDRLIFAPRLPNAEHLARYRVADLALDTFPYTSHTTMSDALWCGCPAVALCGETFAARVSGSLLTCAGLADLVAYSLESYEALALGIATDSARHEEVRARVVRARDESPLFDSARFTLDLEEIFLRIGLRSGPA